jgi:hypothetical protein
MKVPMTSPDVRKFVESLFSLEHKYDAVKAREYYLRTRDLKGRTKGKVLSYEVDDPKKPLSTAPLSKKETKEAKKLWISKEDQDRVDKLQKRFDKLQKVLADLTQQKSKLEGPQSDDTKSKDAKSAKSDSKPEHKTAAEKAKAAKKAKEDREKEGDPSLSAQAKALDAKIKAIGVSIKKMKETVSKAQHKDQAKEKNANAKN